MGHTALSAMDLGYQGRLFLLAFDHRDSFKYAMFGIAGSALTAVERKRLEDAKHLLWEGFLAGLAAGAPAGAAGLLVDEELGTPVIRAARETGVRFAVPVERSGGAVFDFEYGEDFGAHLAALDPGFAKALVRWNPAHDPALKRAQADRLRRLSDWLRPRHCRFLFELLVPATARQLALVGGDTAAYDRHLRPALMLEAVYEIQEAGIEPDVWKIEGLDAVADCSLLSGLMRRDGRAGVKAVVLGRGADTSRVEHWVRTAATVPGYAGFAIGRTIWWDAVAGWREGSLSRPEAAAAIGDGYRQFIDIYEKAAAGQSPA